MYTPFDSVNDNKVKGNRIAASEWNAVCRQLGIVPQSNRGFAGDGINYNISSGNSREYCIGYCSEQTISPYSVLALHPSGSNGGYPPRLRLCQAGTVVSGSMANGLVLFTNRDNYIYQNQEGVVYPIGNSDVVRLMGTTNLTVGGWCGAYNSFALDPFYGGFVCVARDTSAGHYDVLRCFGQTLYGEAAETIQGGSTTIKVKINYGNSFTSGSTQITAYNFLMRNEEYEIKTGNRVVVQWSDYNLRWILTQSECVPDEQ